MKSIHFCLFLLLGSTPFCSIAEPFQIVPGKTQITIPENAGEEMRSIAETLQTHLAEIFDSKFEIQSDSPPSGIFLKAGTDPVHPHKRETYTIKTSRDLVVLSGVTTHATRNATWDFLHRLGYRQFFPGKNWEIVPRHKSFTLNLDIKESPDYVGRRIWYGFGLWDHNPLAYRTWCQRNRMAEAFKLHTGHAYGNLIHRNQAIFDKHPEFYALIDGKRDIRAQAKFCIGNPELRKTIVDYTLSKVAADPSIDSVSMDPSDGGGWCECDLCKKIGSPSDRAVLLANEVAAAINRSYPGKVVGMYAYNYHSPPPKLEVSSHVVISTATAFIKGGIKIDDLIEGWSKKGATIGIREYYSVNTWDRDRPGAARGSNLDYLCETIPGFHQKGARFLSAESGDNWGCNGLGYYLASRLLWDVDQAANRDAIVEDFLSKSFGKAIEPMREFYQLIDGSNKRAKLVPEDQIGRMFRLLKEARDIAGQDESTLRRLDDLTLYTQYVALFDRYQNLKGEARQSAFENLIRHAYRMRNAMLVHSYALYRDLHRRDKSVTLPENAHWKIPEPKNPWKSSSPFSGEEISEFLEKGIAEHNLVELDFEPAEFSENLVPAELPTDLRPGSAKRARGQRSYFTWTDSAGKVISLRIKGGLISHYRDRGNVKVDLWKIGGPSEKGEAKTLISQDRSIPPDGVERELKLRLPEPGVYRIDLNDGLDSTEVTWPEGQLMSWKMTLEDRPRMLTGRWAMFFFVPSGTARIGLYADIGGGRLVQPDGKKAKDFSGGVPGRFLSVGVPEGMDGKLWKFEFMAGKISLLNVPPYLAARPDELLLPAELK